MAFPSDRVINFASKELMEPGKQPKRDACRKGWIEMGYHIGFINFRIKGISADFLKKRGWKCCRDMIIGWLSICYLQPTGLLQSVI